MVFVCDIWLIYLWPFNGLATGRAFSIWHKKNFCFKQLVNQLVLLDSWSTLWATQPDYFNRVLDWPVRMIRIRMTGDWESRRQLVIPVLPWKWPLKWRVSMSVRTVKSPALAVPNSSLLWTIHMYYLGWQILAGRYLWCLCDMWCFVVRRHWL